MNLPESERNLCLRMMMTLLGNAMNLNMRMTLLEIVMNLLENDESLLGNESA